jgi:hypothetical protein
VLFGINAGLLDFSGFREKDVCLLSEPHIYKAAPTTDENRQKYGMTGTADEHSRYGVSRGMKRRIVHNGMPFHQ